MPTTTAPLDESRESMSHRVEDAFAADEAAREAFSAFASRVARSEEARGQQHLQRREASTSPASPNARHGGGGGDSDASVSELALRVANLEGNRDALACAMSELRQDVSLIAHANKKSRFLNTFLSTGDNKKAENGSPSGMGNLKRKLTSYLLATAWVVVALVVVTLTAFISLCVVDIIEQDTIIDSNGTQTYPRGEAFTGTILASVEYVFSIWDYPVLVPT